MENKNQSYSPPASARRSGGLLRSRWLWAVALLLGAFTSLQAQTKDVITFTGGHADANNPDIYVIDAGPDDLIADPEGGDDKIRIKLSRPYATEDSHEASITLNSLTSLWDEGTTVTFAPGEITKTVNIEAERYASESYSGNAPVVFGVLRTDHAEAAYDVVIYNINHTATEDPALCEYATPLEVLQANGFDYREIYCFRWGQYVVLAFDLVTDVRISADSRLVLQTRYTDHCGLPIDADDYGMSRTRNVVLTPINVGAVSSVAMYLYRPSDDEYMYSFRNNVAYNGMPIDNTITMEGEPKRLLFEVSELGPFEVANPAEEAMTSIFFSQEDLQNTFFLLNYQTYAFMPQFSNVALDKTSYKSGETMVITATMDNWRVVKRALLNYFMNGFGVTLDGNQSIEPRRFTFDEQTGTVTYYVTAPNVATNTTVTVDFGAIAAVPIIDDEGWYIGRSSLVVSDIGSSFAVTVTPEAATEVPATTIDFVDMPANGSNIHLEKLFGKWLISQVFPLTISSTPIGATNAGNVTYSVTNSNGANATIVTKDDGSSYLDTGESTGDFTVAATLSGGVSTSRSYHLWTRPGGRVANLGNEYIVGTTFPKFQFQLEGWDEWTADENNHPEGAVTVNYTDANGTTWTEHYKLSQLQKHQHESISSAVVYDLPFSFTDEHPDIDHADMIGETYITAQVLIHMDNNGEKAIAEATATLRPELKTFSIEGYADLYKYFVESHPVAITSEVMYLPRMGFTVGYEMPEIGISETYNSGDPLPEWLTLEESGDYYYHAHINVKLYLEDDAHFYFYTTASSPRQWARIRNYWCVFQKVSVEGNLVYQVNGENVTGDLILDNTQNIQTILNTIQTEGVYQDTYETIEELCYPRFKGIPVNGVIDQTEEIDLAVNPLNLPAAYFCVNDRFFDDGANVTLTCDGDTIQTLTGYKGSFFFQPPSDGHTYNIKVYFPAYDKTYNTTLVSHDLTNLYHVDLEVNNHHALRPISLKHFEGGEAVNLYFKQTQNASYYYPINTMNGIVRIENPSNCYLMGSYYGNFRLSLDWYLHKLKLDSKPELVLVKEWDRYLPAVAARLTYDPYKDINAHSWGYDDKWYFYGHKNINVEALRNSNTRVTVVNGQGEPITDATLHYACVDALMTNQGSQGSATYDNNLGCYPIQTDAGQFAQLIEVVPASGSGYESKLTTMYLWNYNPNTLENIGKPRRHTIVLHQDDNQLKSLTLETPKRDGVVKDNNMVATINADNLLMMNSEETLNYSQTADKDEVTKHMYDGKFGAEGWHGMKYAHLTGMLSYQEALDPTKLQLEGFAQQPTLTTTLLTTTNFPFSQNYCLFDFDLTDQIEDDAKLTLKNGTTALAELPTLHNHDIDQAAMDEASNVSLAFDCPKLNEVDDQARDNDVDMKDMNKAFDRLNFQLPPVLPFTVNIERNGDYYIVRACVEKNFLPGGQIINTLEKLEKYQYFDEQFQACMDAVNTAKQADDDFFDDIPRWPSAFAGIKGFLSGIGYYNRETGKFEITFLDGGLTLEASTAARANVSFFIGGFGMSIDAKIAMTMGLINTAAEMGDVSAASTKIDFVFDYQTRLKVCAWAYGGIDIWIASATAGVRGGACIDLRDRAYVVKGLAGMKTTLTAKMEAYAEARFLCWTARKSWNILDASKTWLAPDNASNPFHPSNAEPVFSFTQQNVTKNYRKLRRKVIADLGDPIISNVSGMARPNYMLGGESLLFNNLDDPSEYNDDRLQIYRNKNKSNLVNTGIDAPMYDFVEAHNTGGLELVAFEQIKENIDGSELETMSANDQTKSVTEKSEIYVAMRRNGGSWTHKRVGYYSGNIGCVTPAVAIQEDGNAVVVWQQGLAKFNEQGYRYIDGSLMLSRYDGNNWGEPIEIKRLHHRSVPADYQVSMKGDSILVMMALQQDVNNTMKQSSMVYVSISPNDKVRERYTQVEATKPQMVNVNGANLVGYIKTNESGRDIELSTVNMKGEPTGKLSGSLGMDKRVVNDFRLIVEDEATDLTDVALLWSQSDQETTYSSDGTATVEFKNHLYASKLCSHDKELYFSTPIQIATMPDDVSLVSMDGYLDGLDMKVAYCVANDQEGAAVMETPVAFTNAIDHKINFNPYEVTDDQQVPVTFTVVNNGFEPIDRIDVTMGNETSSHEVMVMPQEKTELTAYYLMTDDFDGTINYEVAANFIPSNSNALKIKRRGAKAADRPHRIEQSGLQMDVRQVDIALNMLSKKTGADGKTTIIAEVNNASLLPLSSGLSVKVGLYYSPLASKKVEGTTEVTITASELYDADAKQNNVKIVTLTVNQPEVSEVFYLCITPMEEGEALKDVRPANNVLPISLVGKFKLGDTNHDTLVNMTDAQNVVNAILGKPTTGTFYRENADVSREGDISISDAVGIVNIILNDKGGSAKAKPHP